MDCIPFLKSEHLEMVNTWRKEWGMLALHADVYPEIGFIVPGIAAAFLYITGTVVGYFENLISNPHVSSQVRLAAISIIDEKIEKVAKDCGIKILIGRTDNLKLIDRSQYGGWEKDKDSDKFVILRKILSSEGVFI